MPLLKAQMRHLLHVRLVLTRISFDPSQYRIFMDMLKDITGMDIIVKIIEGMIACSHLNSEAKLCLCHTATYSGKDEQLEGI